MSTKIEKKLRLVVTHKCDRHCEGCCNKQWDLTKLPVCEDYSPYDIIMLTGGEPLYQPYILRDIICEIRKSSKAKIYIYTAALYDLFQAQSVLAVADGMTVTLHDESDVKPFLAFDGQTREYFPYRSMRLNVFKGVQVPPGLAPEWIIKDNMKWISNCPLPEGEVFMQVRKGHCE